MTEWTTKAIEQCIAVLLQHNSNLSRSEIKYVIYHADINRMITYGGSISGLEKPDNTYHFDTSIVDKIMDSNPNIINITEFDYIASVDHELLILEADRLDYTIHGLPKSITFKIGN